jgi:hypothetical protein
MSWATVRIGIASRTPNTNTSIGNRTAAPPNPVTAASIAATKATAARTRRRTGSGIRANLLEIQAMTVITAPLVMIQMICGICPEVESHDAEERLTFW